MIFLSVAPRHQKSGYRVGGPNKLVYAPEGHIQEHGVAVLAGTDIGHPGFMSKSGGRIQPPLRLRCMSGVGVRWTTSGGLNPWPLVCGIQAFTDRWVASMAGGAQVRGEVRGCRPVSC